METYALVTGANRGIGLEIVRALRARGENVIAVCRKAGDALPDLGARIEEGVDVTDQNALAALASRLQGVRLHALVLNAGVLVPGETFQPFDADAIRRQFEINALAPLRMASLLAQQVVDGGKIALITSRMGSIADNTSGGYWGYRMSKAALNMAGVTLAIELQPRKIAVALLHPGFVRTEMTGGAGNVEPDASARDLVARLDALTMETSGSFWHANGERLPW